MLRNSLFACALVVCGCKSKAPTKQTPTGSGSASTSAKPLPNVVPVELVEAGPKVSHDTIAHEVYIDDDGKLTVAVQVQASANGLSPVYNIGEASLDKLAKEIGLPPVVKRVQPMMTEEGSDDTSAGPTGDRQFALLGHPADAHAVPLAPPRLTSAFAIAHPFDVSAGVLVWASPAAPAGVLVDVLHTTGGFIAVKRGKDLGAVAFAFDRQEPPAIAPTKPWLEMQLGKPSRVALIPGMPMPLDANKLEDIVKTSGQSALDILVAPDSTVGDLVHAIELARAAGIVAIGLGRAPATGSIDETSRAPQGPRVIAWDFFFQGMDKTDPKPFEKALDDALVPIHDCYAKLLAKSKDLGGTAHVEMMLAPSGKVGELQTTGVDKALGACAGDALGKATFPAIAQSIKLTAQLAFLPR